MCSLLITAVIFEQRTAGLVARQDQNYGEALARTAAQQAVDATLNHDLVSLQVTLQDVAANPGVRLATIHDVENNLLVQAGDASRRLTDGSVSTYTAPITLHDSVAGYVTLTMAGADTRFGATWTSVAVIGLLLILIGGLSLYEHRASVFIRRPATKVAGSSEAKGVPPQDDDLGPVTPVAQANARLHLINYAELRHRLTADLVAGTSDQLNALLDEVLVLYNGSLSNGGADDYELRFVSTESGAEAAFRAVCAVHLIERLAREVEPMAVLVAAEVALDQSLAGPTSTSNDDATRDTTAPGAGIWLAEDATQALLPQQRLRLAEAPGRPGYAEVVGFQEPLARLLDRQYEQLQAVR